MDFCNVTLQISRFPRENVKKWGIEKVRDYLAYKQHVNECSACQAVMDTFLEKHKDEPKRPDPTSLN